MTLLLEGFVISDLFITRFHCTRVHYTLLKSNVTDRDPGVRCRGSQECGLRFVSFACKFHTLWHESSHNSEIYNIGARAQ